MTENINMPLSIVIQKSEHENDSVSSESHIENGWINSPTIDDLKYDYNNARNYHQEELDKVNDWLDALEVKGKHKNPTRKHFSNLHPKYIRQFLEWRKSSLTHAFLDSDDLVTLYPVSKDDMSKVRSNNVIINNQLNNQMDTVRFIDDFVETAMQEGTVIVRVGWSSSGGYSLMMQDDAVDHLNITGLQPNQLLDQSDRLPLPDDELIPIDDNIIQGNDIPVSEESFLTEQVIPLPDQHHALLPEQGVPQDQISLPEQISSEELLGDVEQSVMSQDAAHQQSEEESYNEMDYELSGKPELHICDFASVRIDPHCKEKYQDAKFVTYEFEQSYYDLVKSGIYKNLNEVEKNINSLTSSGQIDSNKRYEQTERNRDNFNYKDKKKQPIKIVEYWGNWDINNDNSLVPIVAAWAGNVLIRLEINKLPFNSHPFVFTSYIPRKNVPYGFAEAEFLSDNQRIYGAIMRGIIDLLGKSAAGQTAFLTGALDTSNREKFEQGESFDIKDASEIPTNDIDKIVKQFSFPEIPNSVFQVLGMINSVTESATGIKSFSEGLNNSSLSSPTANVPAIIMSSSEKRDASIVRRLSQGIKEIVRKIIALNSALLPESFSVRLTANEFVNIDNKDMGGIFDINIKTSSKESDQQKLDKMAMIFQTLGDSAPQEVKGVLLADMMTLMGRPDVGEQIKKVSKTPDNGIDNQLAMLQIEENKAKIAETKSKALLNNAIAELKRADAIKSKLSTIEQEGGTTQERDLQKIKMQSVSQADLARKQARARIEEEIEKKNLDLSINKEEIK